MVLAAVASVLPALAFSSSGRRNPICVDEREATASFWNDAQRDAMHRAFLATGQQYAERAFQAAASRIDAHVNEWTRTRTEVCEATWIHGQQSPELLDRRMMCLDRDLAGVQALVRVLVQNSTASHLRPSAGR